MGRCREQKEQEKDEGYLSGEGEATGRSDGSNLPQGWRDRRNDPSLPGGWSGKPTDHTTGPPGAAPAGRGGHVKKRKIRRGGGGGETTTTSLRILNNNICGWNSKKNSVPDILEKLNPDVCIFQETALAGTNQLKIKNFHCSVRNRKDFKRMGGVATAVHNHLKSHTIKVKEGENKDEFIITRLDHINPPLNIINVYGGIEDRMDNQEILENWGRIKTEIDKIGDRNEFCLLIGDLNRAIGAGRLGIQGNRTKISYGGKLLLELLETGEYVLGNSTDKVEGGPWTWVSRADHRVSSCIDLVIMSADLAPYLKRILIDVEHKYAPARLRMVAGRKRLVYSDHYPIVVEFENLPKGWIATETASSWNMNQPEGWKTYERLTEAASEKINNII